MFQRCHETLDATSHRLRCWINTVSTDGYYPHPLQGLQKKGSEERYISLWKRFFCYGFRVWATPRDLRAEIYGLVLNEQQETIMSKIWNALDDALSRDTPGTSRSEVDQDQGHDSDYGIIVSSTSSSAVSSAQRLIVSSMGSSSSAASTEAKSSTPAQVVEWLFALSCQFVAQVAPPGTEDSLPLVHFVGVLGIHSYNLVYRSAFAFTPSVAGLLWVCRLLMLEYALPLRHYDHINWPSRVQKCSDLLTEAMFGWAPPAIDLLALHDDLTENRPGWSFLKELGNHLEHSFRHLQRQAFTAEHLMTLSKTISQLSRNAKAGSLTVATYRQAAVSIAKTHIPSIPASFNLNHPTNENDTYLRIARQTGHSIQTLRSDYGRDCAYPCQLQPELMSQYERTLEDWHQWLRLEARTRVARHHKEQEASVKGCSRNVKNCPAKERRLLQKLMVAMQLDDIRGVSHYVVRFLPDRLRQVLIKYIAYIDPFARPLPMDRRSDEFLFSGPSGPWTGIEGTETLIEATNKYLGVRLTWGAWRQVAIGFKDWLLYKEMKVFKEEEKGDDDEDDEEEFESMELNTLSYVMDRQSAHSSRTARAHYAVDSNFLSGLRPALIHAYETASLAWHNMLGVGSVKDTGLKGGKHRRSISDVLCVDENKKSRPGKTLTSQNIIKEDNDIDIADKIQTGLTKLFGPQGAPQSTG
ncbi:hypothetical protein V500_03937 [Pseudogymnoascus sp. VKM F-4518 (FW-2643)]|nr:hypothetical protein V500_03937 [Pseudogymnoascus sp. VKM F-4518 (FW-2643)]